MRGDLHQELRLLQRAVDCAQVELRRQIGVGRDPGEQFPLCRGRRPEIAFRWRWPPESRTGPQLQDALGLLLRYSAQTRHLLDDLQLERGGADSLNVGL